MGWCNHNLVKEDILICSFYMLLGSVERRCFFFVQCWYVRAGASNQACCVMCLASRPPSTKMCPGVHFTVRGGGNLAPLSARILCRMHIFSISVLGVLCAFLSARSFSDSLCVLCTFLPVCYVRDEGPP